MSAEKIYDMTRSDLEEHILGHQVVAVTPANSTITLANGTVLEFEDTEDCCAWFSAELEAGNLVENVVTSVTAFSNSDDPQDESWKIHILAADNVIGTVSINGTESSGYYCKSVNLIVHKKTSA